MGHRIVPKIQPVTPNPRGRFIVNLSAAASYLHKPLALNIENGQASILTVCINTRYVYGSDRLLVAPVCGKGQFWVEPDRCTVVAETWPGKATVNSLAVNLLVNLSKNPEVWDRLPPSVKASAEALSMAIEDNHANKVHAGQSSTGGRASFAGQIHPLLAAMAGRTGGSAGHLLSTNVTEQPVVSDDQGDSLPSEETPPAALPESVRPEGQRDGDSITVNALASLPSRNVSGGQTEALPSSDQVQPVHSEQATGDTVSAMQSAVPDGGATE